MSTVEMLLARFGLVGLEDDGANVSVLATWIAAAVLDSAADDPAPLDQDAILSRLEHCASVDAVIARLDQKGDAVIDAVVFCALGMILALSTEEHCR